MPSYQLSLIMKALERPQVAGIVKRVGESILEQGGVLRSFDNIGSKGLPHKMWRDGKLHKQGHYFLVNFDVPVASLATIKDLLKKDADIIRPRILRKEVEIGRPCEEQPCDFGENDDETYRRTKAALRKYIHKV